MGKEKDFLNYGFQTNLDQYCLDYKKSKKLEKEQVRKGSENKERSRIQTPKWRFLNAYRDIKSTKDQPISVSTIECNAEFLFSAL